MTILNIKVGIIADRLVRVVLDNVAVHDVGLARLHVVVFNDGGQQLSEDLEEVCQHGRYTRDAGPATWWRLLALTRRLGLVQAAVVFGMTRHPPHAVVGLVVDPVGTA